ncbi:ATP-binding protein [Roseburia inulinivorans]|uniref:AAA family ATPase n=1 Tax=Roseburia inulinivorans TaxID=360807 RepID=A0A396AFY3_9FIRM|nr:AAA family ATPase [Roseburia inulinivorans]RHD05443.1 AAA family ATPase [Roseburia inulinivorans]
MNIKQAKEEIKHTVQAYLSKDAFGEYKIPAVRQRPVLLIGPPGIGKTQIMEQIARECEIGLVAYTITHHTRQSAVGLPFIKEEQYDGKTYSVTEYTMSEIIASVYRKIEEGGRKEGILFIDEINCVSETLAPTMLQFLQCKTFGNQAVPEGWIIAAAGNPPEYNKSVRDFDMVTLDRVRCMNIEADLGVWKEYAREKRLNSAILSYLELRPKNFYRVEADVDGLQFVTARGWEDLSNLMDVYEELGIPVDEEIIHEFLRHEDVAEDVSAYFDLYKKYQDDYGIAEILEGKVKPSVYARIDQAAFDERLSVVSLLLDGVSNVFYQIQREREITDAWYDFLKEYRQKLKNSLQAKGIFETILAEKTASDEQNEKQQFVSKAQSDRARSLNEKLKECAKKIVAEETINIEETALFALAKEPFDAQCEKLQSLENQGIETLEHAFTFMEQAFSDGQEMVVFVTELTITPEIAVFLSEHRIERYETYKNQLLIGTKRAEILSEIARD